jgi:hypothetical protein
MAELGDKIFGTGDKFRKFIGKETESKPFKEEEHGTLGVLIHELRGEKGQKIKAELKKLGGAAKEQIDELKEFTDTAISIHKGEVKVTPKEKEMALKDWVKELENAKKKGDTETYNKLLEQAFKYKMEKVM